MNKRIIIVGAVLVGLAAAFFFGMAMIVPESNDPVAMMQTVGTVSGVVVGLGIVMILFGIFKKRR